MFAEGKSFPHSAAYTIGNSAPIFPHVKNTVENVQKSSLYAHFPGGIPQFPPSFQPSRFDTQTSRRTFCKIQVGIMTIF
jgi:hypothetical protein